jgi:hypothetical protein
LNEEDARLDQLLGGGSLGGPHYDEILQRVLHRTEVADVRPARRAKAWFAYGTALASAVAASFVLFGPAREHFASKGSANQDAHALGVGCTPSGGPCRAGETLMFTVNAALTSGHLGAYAERVDDRSQERIWYFPTETGAAPFVAPGSGTVVLSEGIEIGREHRPGRYRVTVLISSRPLDRSQIDGAGRDVIASRSTFEVDVLP